MVELFRAMNPVVHAPIWLFPSVEWVKEHVGRWVVLNGCAGGARIVPSPNELCRHATDQGTGELSLFCVICGVEMGRLPPRTPQMDVRALTRKISRLLHAHVSATHPEILDAFK